jgi:hypothetical protein
VKKNFKGGLEMRKYPVKKCSDCPDHFASYAALCNSPQNKWGVVHITNETQMIDGFPSWCPLEVCKSEQLAGLKQSG